MSLHPAFVTMETHQSDFVHVVAAWLSWTGLNRPWRLFWSFIRLLIGRSSGAFGQIKGHCVCVGVKNRKITITILVTFPLLVEWQSGEMCGLCPQAARNVSNTHRWSLAEVAGGSRTECWWGSWKEHNVRLLHTHNTRGMCVTRLRDQNANTCMDNNSYSPDSKEIKSTHKSEHKAEH